MVGREIVVTARASPLGHEHMRSKPSLSNDAFRIESREQRLTAFIANALDRVAGQRSDGILLVARTPDSCVARAIFELSHVLAERGIGANIVFAASTAIAMGEEWKLQFHPGFSHEIRMITNPRFLAAHEQLVIGTDAVWFGDSMRREPDKRDAFSSFSTVAIETARARWTFGRLWSSAEPVYAHNYGANSATTLAGDPNAHAANVLSTGTAEISAQWEVRERR
jgi:hypothetical protein